MLKSVDSAAYTAAQNTEHVTNYIRCVFRIHLCLVGFLSVLSCFSCQVCHWGLLHLLVLPLFFFFFSFLFFSFFFGGGVLVAFACEALLSGVVIDLLVCLSVSLLSFLFCYFICYRLFIWCVFLFYYLILCVLCLCRSH